MCCYLQGVWDKNKAGNTYNLKELFNYGNNKKYNKENTVKDLSQYFSPYDFKSLKLEFNKLQTNKLSEEHKRYMKQLNIRCCKTAIFLEFDK